MADVELSAAEFEMRDEAALRAEYWRVGWGDVVIDVGCGYGSYTIPALAAGATVYAVDADGNSLQGLTETARGVSGLIPLHLALYDGREYPARLREQIAAAGWGWMAPDGCEWATLDDLTVGLDRVDWVKIDVEGAELGVLRGGLKTLRDFHPRLIIEDHSGVYSWVRQMGSARHITRLLSSFGYSVEVVPYVGPGRARSYFVCLT